MKGYKQFRWTEDLDSRLRVLISQGLSTGQAADQLGCAQSCAYRRARFLDLKLQCSFGNGGLRRGRPLRHPFVEDGVCKIPLTQGLFATVDIADMSLVSGRNWFASKRADGTYYVSSAQITGDPFTHLHRAITGAPIQLCVDHINGDPLNNTRANLRICTYAQNCFNKKIGRMNTSGKTGVCRKGKKWEAKIHVQDRVIRLGRFDKFEDALNARLRGEKTYFGEFARPQVLVARLAFLTTPRPGVYVINIQIGNAELEIEISEAHLANIIITGTDLLSRNSSNRRVPNTPTENAPHERAGT